MGVYESFVALDIPPHFLESIAIMRQTNILVSEFDPSDALLASVESGVQN